MGDVLETILCDSVAVPSTFGNYKHAIQSVILLWFKMVIPKQKYHRNMWFQGIKTFWSIVQAVILSLVRHVWYQNSNKNSCASIFNLAFKSWSKSSLSKSKHKSSLSKSKYIHELKSKHAISWLYWAQRDFCEHHKCFSLSFDFM